MAQLVPGGATDLEDLNDDDNTEEPDEDSWHPLPREATLQTDNLTPTTSGEGPDPEVPLKGVAETTSDAGLERVTPDKSRLRRTPGTKELGPHTEDSPELFPTDQALVSDEVEPPVDSFGFKKLFKGTQEDKHSRFKLISDVF